MTALWLVPIIFVFLASALIWFTVGGWGKWWLRLIMMAITCGLAVWAWISIDNVLGTPKSVTIASLAGRSATLYWTVVEEPVAIYLWVKMDGSSELTSYRLPYSRPLHKETESAKNETATSGDPTHIRFGDVEKDGRKDVGGSMVKGEPEIYILPPPLVPSKTR
jgi:hypothetical protein